MIEGSAGPKRGGGGADPAIEIANGLLFVAVALRAAFLLTIWHVHPWRKKKRRRFSPHWFFFAHATQPEFNRATMSSSAMGQFKTSLPLERRKQEAQRMREKYPDRIPVIVERASGSDIADIDKKKYLVPTDLTVGQFVHVIRKRIKLLPEHAIFIFINSTLPPTAAMIATLYEEQKDEDGFLYVTYSGENTFGTSC